VGETLRAALNAIAVVAPDWLRGIAPPDWHERYDRRVEDMRLPETGPKRDAYFIQVGADGFLLLDALDGAGAPPGVAALPAVAVLRRVWARHFERDEGGTGGGAPAGVRLRAVQGRGPGDRVESPYDTEARFRAKSGTSWTGYTAHTIRTQSTIRLQRTLAPWRRAAQWDDVADLQAVLVDDDALDDELQDRLLLGERGLVQPAAHAFAERGQVAQDLLGLGALAA